MPYSPTINSDQHNPITNYKGVKKRGRSKLDSAYFVHTFLRINFCARDSIAYFLSQVGVAFAYSHCVTCIAFLGPDEKYQIYLIYMKYINP